MFTHQNSSAMSSAATLPCRDVELHVELSSSTVASRDLLEAISTLTRTLERGSAVGLF